MKMLYAIVGMKHRGAEDFVHALETGEPVSLIREPTNPHDPNAVQVHMRGRHVGYVKGTQAAQLARIMDAKAKAEQENHPENDGGYSIVGTLVADAYPCVEVTE